MTISVDMYLVNEDAQHVSFRPLERAESASKIELDVILLALHADPHQYTSLRVQIHPQIMRQEVAEPLRI